MTNSKDHAVEGSFLIGRNPFQFEFLHPLPFFILQMLIIICFSRLIQLILKPLRQPAIIAEILAGIVLGPTGMGHIPHFKEIIFPDTSLPFLNLISNFGLVLFLFLIGLELDPVAMKKDFKYSIFISVAGMALPFVTGVGASYALYSLIETDTKVGFPTYVLFLGVAMAITAFPVLARILTELRLLKTKVGKITVASAAIDDVTSWCLLALVISMINAGSGLVALYVFLMGLGYTLLLVLAVRPVLLWGLRRSGVLNRGPSQFVMFIVLGLVFISAFITDAIGIHAIFGGFVIGVIMPHEGGFAVSVTEKIEDLVTVLFLPLYFALSGLKTDVTALNDGLSWAMVALVIVIACLGKIIGCTLAAKASKLSWRESLTVGILMNCKGLVELIVLNLGYDGGVISKRTFVIMVLMALFTTFMTVPLVSFVYPPSIYSKQADETVDRSFDGRRLNLMVCLNKIEHVPAIMTLVQMLQHENTHDHFPPEVDISTHDPLKKPETGIDPLLPLQVYALRLMELTERNSSVMHYSESDGTLQLDPVMNVFRTFSQLLAVSTKSMLRVVPIQDFATIVKRQAAEVTADLIVVPWAGSGTLVDVAPSPLEELFQATQHRKKNRHTSTHHANYVKELFKNSPCCVAVLVDRGFAVSRQPTQNMASPPTSPISERLNIVPSGSQQILLPFFGGEDDRAALDIVFGLAQQGVATVKVLRVVPNISTLQDHTDGSQTNNTTTEYDSYPPTPSLAQSQLLDQQLLDHYFGTNGTDHPNAVSITCGMITYETILTKNPLQDFASILPTLHRKDLVVVGRRQTLTTGILYGPTASRLDGSRRKVLGDLAEAVLRSPGRASLLIVKGRG